MLASSFAAAATHESGQGWEETQSITGNFKAILAQPDIEVFSAPYTVMMKVNHEVDVRIYTILGKLVSSEHLNPGIYKYTHEAHGIYIIKTDETSCKVAI